VFESENLASTTAALAGHGVDIVWAEAPLSPDLRSTLIRDPEGNLINIFGAPERARSRCKRTLCAARVRVVIPAARQRRARTAHPNLDLTSLNSDSA
jgi:hypothetical protein